MHFICTGGCQGVSTEVGVCQTDGCQDFHKELHVCGCEDGTHEMVKQSSGYEETEETSESPIAETPATEKQ